MQKITFHEFINFFKVLRNIKSSNTFLYYELLHKYGDFNATKQKQKACKC